MRGYIKKIALFLCAVLLFCPMLSSCNSNKDENDIAEGESVLKANDYEVSYGLYRYFFLNYKANYTKDEIEADPAAIYSKVEQEVFDSIKGMYAVLELCSEYGITPDSKEIKAEVDITINSIKEQYIDADVDPKGEIGFSADMKVNFMTEEVLRFVSAVDACEAALYTKLIEEKKIPTEQDELRAAVDGDEFIRVLQIYISSENGATRDENKALADKVYSQAIGGADFDELVGSYSNDYAMTKNGYYICRGYMNEEFENKAFSLNIGEISTVLELSDGFHIIKRVEKDAEYINANFNDLAEQYQSCIFYSMIDQKAPSVTITKTEKFAGIDPALIALGK